MKLRLFCYDDKRTFWIYRWPKGHSRHWSAQRHGRCFSLCLGRTQFELNI